MNDILTFLQQFLKPWLVFMAQDPALRLIQGAMLLAGIAVIFLVFYTTRDILLRTHSFFYMFISILLVATLPVVGFFLYLLIRPARTIKERELEMMLFELVSANSSSSRREPEDTQGGVVQKKPAPKKKKSEKPKEDISL